MKKPVVISFGRDSGRDYPTFINALRKLKVEGVIVCSPNNIVKNNSLRNINIYYDISPKSLKEKIRLSDIVVLSSKKVDNTGQLSLLDAMACKRPIIVSNIPGLVDTFNLKDKEDCLLYEPGNSLDLKEKIDLLMSSKPLRDQLAENSYKKSGQYSTKIFAQHLSNIIEQLVQKNYKSKI